MGFNSTITMQDYSQQWPEWFRLRYPKLHCPERGPASSIGEMKIPGPGLFEDIQAALADTTLTKIPKMRVIVLHENGGVTAVDISKEQIAYSEPQAWDEVSFITRNNFDGVRKFPPEPRPAYTADYGVGWHDADTG